MTCIHQEGTPNSTYTNSIWYNQWKVVWKMLYWPDLVAGDGGRTRTAPGISRGLMGCPWLLLSSPPLLSSADDLSFCPSSASSTFFSRILTFSLTETNSSLLTVVVVVRLCCCWWMTVDCVVLWEVVPTSSTVLLKGEQDFEGETALVRTRAGTKPPGNFFMHHHSFHSQE